MKSISYFENLNPDETDYDAIGYMSVSQDGSYSFGTGGYGRRMVFTTGFSAGDIINIKVRVTNNLIYLAFIDEYNHVISYKQHSGEVATVVIDAVVPIGTVKIIKIEYGGFDLQNYVYKFYDAASKEDVKLLPSLINQYIPLSNLQFYSNIVEHIYQSSPSENNNALVINNDNTISFKASVPGYAVNIFDISTETTGTIFVIQYKHTAPIEYVFTDDENNIISRGLTVTSNSASFLFVCAIKPNNATKLIVPSYAGGAILYKLNSNVPKPSITLDSKDTWLKNIYYNYNRASGSVAITIGTNRINYMINNTGEWLYITAAGTYMVEDGKMLIFVYNVANKTASIQITTFGEYIDNPYVLLAYVYKGRIIDGFLLDQWYNKAYASEATRHIFDLIGRPRDYFYTNDYLPNKISEYRTLLKTIGSTGDVFTFFADTHNEVLLRNYQDSPRLIAEFAKSAYLDKVIYGGDLIYAYGTEEQMIQQLWAQVEAYRRMVQPYANVYYCLGNHDIKITDRSVTPSVVYKYDVEETYAVLFKQQESYINQDPEHILGMYYYFDANNAKIRYVILNTITPYNPYSAEQLVWLTNLLQNTPSEYYFVFVGHVPFITDHTGDTTWTSDLYEIIKPYHDRVIGCFCGHEHHDYLKVQDGIVHYVIACDAQLVREDTKSDGITNYDIYNYRHTAINAFDNIFIDMANKTVTCQRVGWGSNRKFKFGENPEIIDLGSGYHTQTEYRESGIETIN